MSIHSTLATNGLLISGCLVSEHQNSYLRENFEKSSSQLDLYPSPPKKLQRVTPQVNCPMVHLIATQVVPLSYRIQRENGSVSFTYTRDAISTKILPEQKGSHSPVSSDCDTA